MNDQSQTSGKALGRHLLLELYECDPALLNQSDQIEEILVDAALTVNATIIDTSFHHFYPHGVSGVVVIAESHLTIHTWPEHCYAAVDVFTCDEDINTEKIQDFLINKFSAKRHQASLFLRGKLNVVLID